MRKSVPDLNDGDRRNIARCLYGHLEEYRRDAQSIRIAGILGVTPDAWHKLIETCNQRSVS